MKRYIKGICIAFLLLVIISIISITYLKSVQNNIIINDVDLDGVNDGEYKGSYETVLVKASVIVSVHNHSITGIEIIKHDNGLGSKAETVVNHVIENQQVNVDVISGATMSSKVIMKAIEQALD